MEKQNDAKEDKRRQKKTKEDKAVRGQNRRIVGRSRKKR